MSIERIFCLAEALGWAFVEARMRTNECGDNTHKWRVEVVRPDGSLTPMVLVDVTGSTLKDALAEATHVLSLRLEKLLSEVEEKARTIRLALDLPKGGADGHR